MRTQREWNVQMVGRGDLEPSSDFGSAKELVDALPHFARRLVRKRDRKNVSRADPFFHHARHAGGDDAGFSRAGARQNEDRPFGGFDRLSLGGIQ
jgi:hypothetical protein